MFRCANSGNIFLPTIPTWLGTRGHVFASLHGLNHVSLKLYDIWSGVTMAIGSNVNKCCTFLMCCNTSLELTYGFTRFHTYSSSAAFEKRVAKIWRCDVSRDLMPCQVVNFLRLGQDKREISFHVYQNPEGKMTYCRLYVYYTAIDVHNSCVFEWQ